MRQYYIKQKANTKERLSNLLATHLNLSSEHVSALIACGAVWDNDHRVRLKDPQAIITTQTLKIYLPQHPVTTYQIDRSDIIYRDSDFLAVYKKAGFPTVPAPYADTNSLSYGLEDFLKKAVVVINRLDRETDGLVLAALNKKCEAHLHAMFKNRRVKKWYLVQTARMSAPFRFLNVQDQLDWKGKAQEAHTLIHFLKQNNRGFFFIASPRTGRTHQIRKHFQKYICPIQGDGVYGKYKSGENLALTCIGYTFSHPTNHGVVRLRFIPPYWRNKLMAE